MNIFLLTWLDLAGKKFAARYDAAKQYKKELGCGMIATTINAQTLDTKTAIGATRLVGVDPGEVSMKAMGGINSGTLVKQIGILQGDERNCYVVSTNKSHHLSWALSKQAFDQHQKEGNPKVVINMDQHTDCGSSTGTLEAENKIECGNWGQYHLKYEGGGNDERYYVVLGCTGKASGIFWNKPKSKNPSGSTTGGDYEVLKKMEAELAGKGCDVYITIDNDVFNTKITHYNAGVLEQKAVWGLLDMALKKMKTLNVVGGDVTGLPPENEKSNVETAISISRAGMKRITDQFK